jgi:hypothetical protein
LDMQGQQQVRSIPAVPGGCGHEELGGQRTQQWEDQTSHHFQAKDGQQRG